MIKATTNSKGYRCLINNTPSIINKTIQRNINITVNDEESNFKPPFIPLISENGIPNAIGNTPLIKLPNISSRIGRNVYAKAEFMNPGGSIKDRAALSIINNAETNGLIKQGGTIVEGTAGNTGIGLAHVCRARGYKCIIYMPNTQSKTKIETLRLLGATVYPVPAVAYSNPENYNHQAKRHAESLDNAVWTNQFDNISNRQAHIDTTGPEIWAQLNGKIDAWTCSTGTGGTFAGVTRYLKTMSNNKVKCIVADAPGSIIYSYIQSNGKDVENNGSSFTEGIGQGRITENLKQDLHLIDDSIKIPDSKTISMLYQLLDEDGLYIGGTGALNVVAAVEIAQSLPENSNVVTILADSAHKYSDRIFSKKWLIEKNLFDSIPEHLKKYAILD